jgi:hypothetical protein
LPSSDPVLLQTNSSKYLQALALPIVPAMGLSRRDSLGSSAASASPPLVGLFYFPPEGDVVGSQELSEYPDKAEHISDGFSLYMELGADWEILYRTWCSISLPDGGFISEEELGIRV